MSDGPLTYRDQLLSVYQSAAAEVARKKGSRRARSVAGKLVSAAEAGAPATPDPVERAAAEVAGRHFAWRRGGPVTPPPASPTTIGQVRSCAELGLHYLEARLRGDTAAVAQIEEEFTAGACDPAWVTTLVEYTRFFGSDGTRGTIPYIRPSQAGERVIEIKAGARIALVSDWGTGAAPASRVLQQIASLQPDVFIHLGDIYYSGTPTECDVNFLKLIQAILGPARDALPVYALAGNHDMYCGGVGYYGLIAGLNPKPLGQPASFFCLRSADERWQLLAMDTALHDYAPLSVQDALTRLEPEEVDWHRRRVAEFAGKTILLSHHQLFSAFAPIGPAGSDGIRSAINPNLLSALGAIQPDGKIAAWFWGHEHSLCIYQPYAGLQKGRCIGHGAVPVLTGDDIYAPLAALTNAPELIPDTRLARQGDVWAHGFALLALGTADTDTTADYYQDLGGKAARVFSEIIR